MLNGGGQNALKSETADESLQFRAITRSKWFSEGDSKTWKFECNHHDMKMAYVARKNSS